MKIIISKVYSQLGVRLVVVRLVVRLVVVRLVVVVLQLDAQ